VWTCVPHEYTTFQKVCVKIVYFHQIQSTIGHNFKFSTPQKQIFQFFLSASFCWTKINHLSAHSAIQSASAIVKIENWVKNTRKSQSFMNNNRFLKSCVSCVTQNVCTCVNMCIHNCVTCVLYLKNKVKKLTAVCVVYVLCAVLNSTRVLSHKRHFWCRIRNQRENFNDQLNQPRKTSEKEHFH
jgi:hypothetical protein